MSYLLNELAQKGHEVHIAYFGEGLEGGEKDFHDVCLHKIEKSSHYDPFIVGRLVKLIRRTKPDVIHSWHYLMDILGGIASRITKKPWLFREPLPHLDSDTTMKTRLRDWLGRWADMIVSNSMSGDCYWAKRYPKIQHRIIPNGLPLDEIAKIEAYNSSELGIESKQKIILYVGQLLQRKNVDSLIHALSEVRKDFDAVEVLCGDGPQKEDLREKADENGVGQEVYFMGQIAKEQVWALMKRADVFVFLSSNEGCPNAVIEAMACGCPLIVSDIPAHREILNEKSALFVAQNDLSQVSDAIIQVFKNQNATHQRVDIAKKLIRDRSITNMTRQYESVYRKILSGIER